MSKIKNSKIFFFANLSFILGILTVSFFAVPEFIVWEFFILGAFYFSLFLFKSHKQQSYHWLFKGVVLGLCLMTFSLGLFRGLDLSYGMKSKKENFSISFEKKFACFSFVKEKFRQAINNGFPNPQGAILAGVLLGDRASFSKEWKEKLSNTGTSHIVAVSGMNIVMLSAIAVSFFVLLGLYRTQALIVSLVFVWLFIALVGFQVSAVRAGVMGSILILCRILGRQGASFRALVLAVALMLAISPELLRYSLSFQLSVLATSGLIHLGVLFREKLKSETIASTFSAQIFTLPVLIYDFGRISLLGVFVNILIVPLLSLVMVLGIGFLTLNFFSSQVAAILSWPLGALLSFIVWVIDIFSRIPFAVFSF